MRQGSRTDAISDPGSDALPASDTGTDAKSEIYPGADAEPGAFCDTLSKRLLLFCPELQLRREHSVAVTGRHIGCADRSDRAARDADAGDAADTVTRAKPFGECCGCSVHFCHWAKPGHNHDHGQ